MSFLYYKFFLIIKDQQMFDSAFSLAATNKPIKHTVMLRTLVMVGMPHRSVTLDMETEVMVELGFVGRFGNSEPMYAVPPMIFNLDGCLETFVKEVTVMPHPRSKSHALGVSRCFCIICLIYN